MVLVSIGFFFWQNKSKLNSTSFLDFGEQIRTPQHPPENTSFKHNKKFLSFELNLTYEKQSIKIQNSKSINHIP